MSLELLTKGRALATKLGVKLEAIALGEGLKDVEKQVFPYGVDVLWVGDDARLAPYTTLPHTKMLVRLFDAEKPQVALMGATSVGRDLGPRVSSALHSGLTADCTSLEIGEYTDAKSGKKPGMSSADGYGSRGCDEERNFQSSTSGGSKEVERGRVFG